MPNPQGSISGGQIEGLSGMTISAPPYLRGNLGRLNAQARRARGKYGADMPRSLFEAAALACLQAREEAGLSQAYIAAFADRDQSTIDRFEKKAKTGKLEIMLLAYSMATGITPHDLLKRVDALWEPSLADATEQALLDALQQPGKARLGTARKRRATRSRRAT
jgi:hypothetical protein